MSKLPLLNITTPYWKADWDDNESFYQIYFAVYGAAYCWGVSIRHLILPDNVHPIITSLMRYRLYFTVRRLQCRIQGSERMCNISREFGANELHRNIDYISRHDISTTQRCCLSIV